MGGNGQNTKQGRFGSGGTRAKTPPPPQPTVDAKGFSDTDLQGYHDLYNGRGYYQQQGITATEQAALDLYLDPNTTRGSLYNFSQNMNYHMANGTATKKERDAFNTIEGSMHNVGYNINLTRYDHGSTLDDMLADVGISSRRNLSLAQIKSALVGHSYTDSRILSTSYNNFKNASDPSTFTTREVKITYRTKAGAQGMMPGIGKTPLRGSGMRRGDDFGEFLLSSRNNYKIVDVKLSGAMARPKGGSKYYLPLQQIEVVVEVG